MLPVELQAMCPEVGRPFRCTHLRRRNACVRPARRARAVTRILWASVAFASATGLISLLLLPQPRIALRLAEVNAETAE